MSTSFVCHSLITCEINFYDILLEKNRKQLSHNTFVCVFCFLRHRQLYIKRADAIVGKIFVEKFDRVTLFFYLRVFGPFETHWILICSFERHEPNETHFSSLVWPFWVHWVLLTLFSLREAFLDELRWFVLSHKSPYTIEQLFWAKKKVPGTASQLFSWTELVLVPKLFEKGPSFLEFSPKFSPKDPSFPDILQIFLISTKVSLIETEFNTIR